MAGWCEEKIGSKSNNLSVERRQPNKDGFSPKAFLVYILLTRDAVYVLPKSEGNHRERARREITRKCRFGGALKCVSGVDFCYFDLYMSASFHFPKVHIAWVPCNREKYGCVPSGCGRFVSLCANKKTPLLFCTACVLRVEFMLGSVPHNGILRRLVTLN